MSNEWFEKGELPPIGYVCEATWGKEVTWHKCLIIPDSMAAVKSTSGSWILISVDDLKFRPIKSEREKAIEAANEIWMRPELKSKSDVFGALFDAGMLRLPENKNE